MQDIVTKCNEVRSKKLGTIWFSDDFKKTFWAYMTVASVVIPKYVIP